MLRWKNLFENCLAKNRLPKGVRRKQRSQVEPSRRMRLETLEDRRMLATITVNSFADDMVVDGNVTLREAILAANTDTSVDGSVAGSGADTINFVPALAGQTVNLNGTELAITETLTIDSTGLLGSFTINAGLNSRIFNITAANGNFTLAGLTLTNGRTVGNDATGVTTNNGGAIRSVTSGNLTIDRSMVSGSSTTGTYAYGGGIYTYGNLTLTNSTVTGNSTTGYNSLGGGIDAYGNVTLTNSTVSGNFTTGTNALGGGIAGYANVLINNSVVSGNNTAGGGAYGGGVYASGNVTVSNSTVSGNYTTGLTAGGGGVYAYGNITLTNSTVSGNNTAGANSAGGGLATAGNATLTNSTLSGNSTVGANSVGGGLALPGTLTVYQSTVTANSTLASNGGGIYQSDNLANYALTITDSIIAGNMTGAANPDLVADPDSTLTSTFSLIQDLSGLSAAQNAAFVGAGGNLTGLNPILAPLENNGGLTQTHALLVGSPAIDAGNPAFAGPAVNDQRGAPFVRVSGAAIDMGAYERQAVAPLNLVVDTLVDENDGDYSPSDLSLREAVGLANGSVGTDTITFAPNISGGTIFLDGTEIAIIEALTIDATALAGGVTVDAQMNSRIFNITAVSGSYTLAGLTLVNGFATGNGGAVLSSTLGFLTIDRSTISGNGSTAGDGGGVSARGNLTLTSTTVSGNSTVGNFYDGGGLYSAGNMSITNSTISGNSTAGVNAEGGGIYSLGSVTLVNSTVSGNSTAGINSEGGGVYSLNGSVTVNQSTVTNNNATMSNGGGIFQLYANPVMIADSIIAGNMAGGVGLDLRAHPASALNATFSLVQDLTGLSAAQSAAFVGGGGNLTAMNPMLAPLADNGGPTRTHALMVGSPAIDAGIPGFGGLANDQRGAGFARVLDGDSNGTSIIDMGAFELVSPGQRSVDVLLDPGTGLVTVSDRSGLVGGSVIQQNNNVTLTVGQFGGMSGLFVTDPAGVNALTGFVQVSDTQAFVPQASLTPTLAINLQAGDDNLFVNVEGTGLISTPIAYDGGTGSDLLTVMGTPVMASAIDRVTYTPGLQPDEGRVSYDIDTGVAGLDMVIDFDNLEPVVDLVAAATLVVDGNGDDNQMTYSVGSVVTRGLVSVDGFETIEFANKANLALRGMGGDDTIVTNNANLPTGLTQIGILGGDGNDVIRLESLPDSSVVPAFLGVMGAAGEGGDDIIDGSAITVPTPLALVGGAGNDTLTGGAGADVLIGDFTFVSANGGDDTLIDSPGADIFDGGAGNDTLAFFGTNANDTIDIFQNAPVGVVGGMYSLNVTNNTAPLSLETITVTNVAQAPNNAANLPTIERILVNMRAGDDSIRVGHSDAYDDGLNGNGVAAQSIRFEVEGEAPNASDMLVVRDHFMGDTVIQRLGADQRSGSITVGALAPVDYSGIEHTNVLPITQLGSMTGADMMGRLVVFKNDPFEANNTLQTATFLGAGPTINVDPTIDPGGGGPFGIPGDADFYQFVAQETGTLDFQLFFQPIAALGNGNAGLPGNGELNATFFDSDGAPIAGIGASGPLNIFDGAGAKIGERITVPVVRNETYYVRVQGDTAAAVNVYNFTAITVPAPVPELVDLLARSDSGRNNTDDITNINVPTFNIIVDDDRIDQFANINLAPDTVNDNAFYTNPTLLTSAVTASVSATMFTDAALIGGAVPAVGQFVTFLSGGNAFETRMVTAFNAVTGTVTVGTAFNVAPAATDAYVVTAGALMVPADYGVQVFNNGAPIGFAFYTGTGNTWSFTAPAGSLAEGDGNHISAAVWIRDTATPMVIGRHDLSPSLQVTLDTMAPPISFGLVNATSATDGLFDGSDTGVATNGASFSDRVTSDTNPTFWGRAEADAIVTLWLDANGDGIIQSSGAGQDIFLGQTVANPLDGNLAFPPGYWQISSAVDLNDLTTINSTGGAFLRDGVRPLLVSAQDQAGNPVPVGAAGAIGPAAGGTILDALTIFLDTQGPQIAGIAANAQPDVGGGSYDLFDPKPSVNGPSPLINSITIYFVDQPVRVDAPGTANDFLYPALDATIASVVGNYSVVGDSNGQVGIASAVVNQAIKLAGTLTAVTNATTFTDAGLIAAATVPAVGDFITFNNGATAGLWQRVTNFNAATGTITVDIAAGGGPAVGDGYSIVTPASLAHAVFPSGNTTAQETVTGAMNATSFFAANIPGGLAPAVGDYIRFNTGAAAGSFALPNIRRVVAFNAGTGLITLDSAFLGAPVPAVGDGFSLIGGVNTPGSTILAAFPANSASVTLNFTTPLPDDRFTITVSDNLVDPVGNKLDGETDAAQPIDNPTLSGNGVSGDGIPGGPFVGRFTVDTRPEIGVWAAGTALVDINGNLQYDPENVDATNRDLNFQIGFASDNIFAGKFGVSTLNPALASGFDTLAAYGRVGNQWRWMIDTNHDGTITPGVDIINNDVRNINGMPVAGNFDGNAANGDEIGVFDGTRWFLDTNRNFVIDFADTVITAGYRGFPIVGDFNGDGNDDLGTYRAVTNAFGGNLFSIDTNRNGVANATFRVGTAGGFNGFPGVRERAVAADMNADGIDDIGVWLPDGSALNPGNQGEWIFLVSAGANSTVLTRANAGGGLITYTTTPFGQDFSARFGNSFAWPIVGNFDPPVVAAEGSVPDVVSDSQSETPVEPPVSVQETPAEETPSTEEVALEGEPTEEVTETPSEEQPKPDAPTPEVPSTETTPDGEEANSPQTPADRPEIRPERRSDYATPEIVETQPLPAEVSLPTGIAEEPLQESTEQPIAPVTRTIVMASWWGGAVQVEPARNFVAQKPALQTREVKSTPVKVVETTTTNSNAAKTVQAVVTTGYGRRHATRRGYRTHTSTVQVPNAAAATTTFVRTTESVTTKAPSHEAADQAIAELVPAVEVVEAKPTSSTRRIQRGYQTSRSVIETSAVEIALQAVSHHNAVTSMVSDATDDHDATTEVDVYSEAFRQLAEALVRGY